jgi:hypothetical protein
MAHPDIMVMLNENLVLRVKNSRRILIIGNAEERRHQEALVLWEKIPIDTKDIITWQFNAWIGNDINVANRDVDDDDDGVDYVDAADEESSDDGVDEDPKEEVKTRVKKYCVVKKEVCEKKTRVITTPIYVSDMEEKLMDFVSKNDINKNTTLDIYRLAFRRVVGKGVFNIVWDSIQAREYGDKSEKPFPVIRHVFSNVSHYNRRKFKNIFPIMMFAIHGVLMRAGIYNDYPTFNDYENLAAHIVLRGENYCGSIVKNPQLVRPLLEYDEFHSIWNHYERTL